MSTVDTTKEPNLRNTAIIAFVAAILGAAIGGYIGYWEANDLYEKQRLSETQNIAKAIDIDMQFIGGSGNFIPFYNYYKYNTYPSISDSNGTKRVLSASPFYNLNNGLYFVFNQDISRFDYKTSSNIYKFYNNLLNAEIDREFIIQYGNTTGMEPAVDLTYSEMKYLIIDCGDNLPKIREELKDYLQ
jgi:hypothetical protein